jgi:hypothetical protein
MVHIALLNEQKIKKKKKTNKIEIALGKKKTL